MKLFHYFPNYDLQETIEWATDIISCQAKEQRSALRVVPRTRLSYFYEFDPSEVEEVRSVCTNQGAELVMVPVWSEMNLVASQNTVDTLMAFNTAGSSVKVGDTVFVTDGTNYELTTVGGVYGASITITPLSREYTNFYAMVAVPALLASPLQLRKRNAHTVEAKIQFITAADLTYTATSPYPQYNNYDVLTDRPLLAYTGTDNAERSYELFENTDGPLAPITSFDYAVTRYQVSWSLDTRAEIVTLLKWLHLIKGRRGAFYCPTWTRDFVPTLGTTSTDTSLTVQLNASEYTGPICIVAAGGVYFTNMTGTTAIDASTMTLNLSAAVGVTLALSDIEMICRMPLMRSDTDRVNFKYRHGLGADVMLPLKEVPDEL